VNDVITRPDHVVTTSATSARAVEIKFLVDAERAAALIAWARTRLDRDPHGSGAHGDEYATTSVYFDNAGQDVLFGRGSYGVAKYRMRRYGASAIVFVERKLRRGVAVAKRRTQIQIGDTQRLAPIEHLELAGCADARWFHRRVLARQLHPACTVEYRRTARIADTAEGPVRLTVDRDLHAAPVATPGAGAPVVRPVLAGQCVLELKFRGPAPALFKDLIAAFSLDPQPCSKYRLSMHALELAATAPPPAPAIRTRDRAPLALPKMLEV
jgi:hypothetical protein